MFYSSRVNGTRFNRNSKGTQILQFLIENNGATKYEVVTKVLGKVGSKTQLRGYYSVYFGNLVDSGIVTRDTSTHKYHITEHGKQIFLNALSRK